MLVLKTGKTVIFWFVSKPSSNKLMLHKHSNFTRIKSYWPFTINNEKMLSDTLDPARVLNAKTEIHRKV